MKRMIALTLIVAVTAMVGGCCQAQENQIATLRSKMDTLMNQNNSYRNQIADLDKFNQQLTSDSQSKDQQIASLTSQLETARTEAVQKPVADPVEPRRSMQTADGWVSNPFGDKITVGSDVLFSSGRASLTSAGRGALSRIASTIRSTYRGKPVRVYGFTDSDPIRKSKKLWADNLDLSANRAMAVTRYLIARGIAADRIETIAMGATNFVSANSSKSGKAKNRRVEIMVVK